MSNEQVLGLMVVAFITLAGFWMSLKKYMKDERKPLDTLNDSIIRLNENIKNMARADEIRDRRIGEHGKEIEELQKTVGVNTYKIDKLYEEVDIIRSMKGE